MPPLGDVCDHGSRHGVVLGTTSASCMKICARHTAIGGPSNATFLRSR